MEDYIEADATEVKGRADLYDFFRRVFQTEVDAAFVEGMRAMDFSQSEEFASYLQTVADENTEELVGDLKCDFARLFLGMSENPVPPYESVYLSEQHLLMQEQRDQVLAAYRSEGLDVEDHFGLPEDHLAVELAFMNFLCERTWNALEHGNEEECNRLCDVQRSFLADHLVKWVPLFADEVARREKAYQPGASFYACMAKMLEDFVASDAEQI